MVLCTDAMKILFISHTAIFGYDGGSIENFKHYHALRKFADETASQLKILSLDKELQPSDFPAIKKSRLLDVLARVLGHSTFLYIYWQKCRKYVKTYSPDIIVLGRTRMGFIAKDIKRMIPNVKVIVNVENIEYDFVDGYFAGSKSMLNKAAKAYERAVVRRDEREAFKYADHFNFLTNRDHKRAKTIYSFEQSSSVIPICTNGVPSSLGEGNRFSRKKIAFLGSLGYQSNEDAVRWFIQNVWIPHFSESADCSLLVGGSGASKKFASYLRDVSNCSFIGRYSQVADVINRGDIMIAPIQSGAGMKVKVAEALRCGVPIIASHEALIGYEEGLAEGVGGMKEANDADEYVAAITELLKMDSCDYCRISRCNQQIFEKYYSLNRSDKDISAVLLMFI